MSALAATAAMIMHRNDLPLCADIVAKVAERKLYNRILKIIESGLVVS
jgi:hypothetical protein